MTMYKDWFRDYPVRAWELLQRTSAGAAVSNSEVTLLLSVGCLLLNAPYERLNITPAMRKRGLTHYQRDRERANNASLVNEFDRLFSIADGAEVPKRISQDSLTNLSGAKV